MRAIWLENGKLRLERDMPEPMRGEHEVTIAVRRAGICGTDIAMVRGYAGFSGVPGHEFVGDVVDGPPDWLGKRVVAEINVACGQCELCNRELPTHCLNRSVVGIRERQGAFAERVVVPTVNLHEVPDNVPDEFAVLAEPLAAAFEIVEQVDLDPSDRVLIVGAGRLGFLIAHVLCLFSSRVSVLARNSARAGRLSGLPVEVTDSVTGTYDMVVECSGNPDGLALAIECVRPQGKLVLKSTYDDLVSIDASTIVVNEVSLIGSRCGPFVRALAALECGEIELGDQSFARFSLDDFDKAFECARAPDFYKVLFDPGL